MPSQHVRLVSGFMICMVPLSSLHVSRGLTVRFYRCRICAREPIFAYIIPRDPSWDQPYFIWWNSL